MNKSIWDNIFNPQSTGSSLTERDNEQAVRELAEAVLHVEKLQGSGEHHRVLKLIRKKMAQIAENRSEP